MKRRTQRKHKNHNQNHRSVSESKTYVTPSERSSEDNQHPSLSTSTASNETIRSRSSSSSSSGSTPHYTNTHAQFDNKVSNRHSPNHMSNERTHVPSLMSMKESVSSSSSYPLRGARNILKQVQNDYLQCNRLSEDYRQQHRKLMEIYLTMSKLLVLWQQGSSSDGSLSAELMRIVQNSNIMSSDELNVLRRSNDKVMREVYDETTQIDKEYFSSDNPIFKDLTSEQQREVLDNKHMAHSLLKKRMKAMHMLADKGTEDERYRIAFSNQYFGDSDDIVNTAWGTDDLIVSGTNNDAYVSMFKTFLERTGGNGSEWIIPSGMDNVSLVLDHRSPQARKLQVLAHEIPQMPEHGVLGYMYDVFQNTSRDAEGIQWTDITSFLNEHPILFNELDKENEDTFLQWGNDVYNVFQNELEKMYYESSQTVVVPEDKHFIRVKVHPSRLIFVEHVSDTVKRRVSILVDTITTDEMDNKMYKVYFSESAAEKTLSVIKQVKSYAEDSTTTVATLYTDVIGSAPTRYDTLYQIVWSMCIHTGQSYPVIPSLHFVSGLSSEYLENDDLVFWCTEDALTQHIKKINTEMSNPDYDTLHIKGDFRTLESDEEPFRLWREHLSRDTRAFLSMRDVCNHRLVEHENVNTYDIVDKQWLNKIRSDVGVIGSSSSTLEENCLRLYLAITDGNHTDDWLNPTTPVSVARVDPSLLNTLHVDVDNVLFDTYGALLITLYIQLGKTRLCPFSERGRDMATYHIMDDIKNALDTQMELLENLVVHSLHVDYPKHNTASLYTKEFMKPWRDEKNQNYAVFCWKTFRNVFAIPQLHPWKREVDPTTCARELKESLLLDILPIDANLSIALWVSVVDILRTRANRVLDETGTYESAPASPSQTHLLRLVLWNASVWNLSLDDPDCSKYVEEHLTRLTHHAQHPFKDALSIEDISYGHPSPMLIARLFVLCVRYQSLSNKHRKEWLSVFKNAYDSAVTKIRHPVFLAMFLKLRGHFLQTPNVHFLHKLWHMVDVGLWQHDNTLWEHLLEYAAAIEFIGNPALYAHKDYFEELDHILEIAHQVDEMTDNDIEKVRRKLQENFVDEPQHKSAEEVDAQRANRRNKLENETRRNVFTRPRTHRK